MELGGGRLWGVGGGGWGEGAKASVGGARTRAARAGYGGAWEGW